MELEAQNPFPEVVSFFYIFFYFLFFIKRWFLIGFPELLIQIERESLRLGPPFFRRGPGDPERTLAPLSGA